MDRGVAAHVRQEVMHFVACGLTKKADILEKLKAKQVRPWCGHAEIIVRCQNWLFCKVSNNLLCCKVSKTHITVRY